MYTSKLLEDVTSYLFSTHQKGGGGLVLTGRGDSPYSGIRKPDGFYRAVGRIFSKPFFFFVIFLPVTCLAHRNKLSSRVKEQQYIEITRPYKNINQSEDTSTATFAFCISE